MILTIVLASVVLIVLAIYYFLTYNFDYWKKRGIVGPKPTAFFGNTPSLFTQKVHIAYEYDQIYK
jgi:hypothetical protein